MYFKNYISKIKTKTLHTKISSRFEIQLKPVFNKPKKKVLRLRQPTQARLV